MERDGEFISEKLLPVSAPNHEWIVENATIHTYSAVNLGINDGRCANHHTIIGQIQILTLCRYLRSTLQILTIEPVQVLRIEDVAGTDFAIYVLHNRIDCNRVVLHQFFTHGQ